MATLTFGKKSLTIDHKITTTVDCLTDHHNRDGETLIGVSMSTETGLIAARNEVTDAILTELNYTELDEDFTFFVGRSLEKTVIEAVNQIPTSDLVTEDDEDERQIFMLFTWTDDN